MPNPSWGLVHAAAHEHLVVLRNGRVVRAQQGGSAWLWPGDTAARIDTSVHRLRFTADQITQEHVGVQVTGLAVFRVVAPLVAFRMLDLSDPERHRSILEQMFVGATRRLVATLSLEDCLTRRKDALAAELMAEVAPVVSGRGRAEDGTEKGWGIVIDTIEIQDVRVLSEEVFERMQAPFRAQLALGAVKAEAEVAALRAHVAEEAARSTEARRAAMLAHEQARVEAERARAREEVEHAAALRRAEQQARMALAREAAEAAVETARLEGEARRIAAAAAAEATRMERAALDVVSEARLKEIALTQAAPEIARAMRGAFGEITVRPAELAEVVAAVRAAVG